MLDGKNPHTERKRRQAQGLTLREVMKAYIEKKTTKHGSLRERSKDDIEKCITRSLADWLDKPVVNITREDCVKRFQEISKNSPSTANLVFRNLRALLNWIREENTTKEGTYTILPINPVTQAFKNIKWNQEKARQERIPIDKIGPVWNMLTDRTDIERFHPTDVIAAHLIMFLILT